MIRKRAAEPAPEPNDAAPAAPTPILDLADAIAKMAEAQPDLMRVVEDVADVQPELAGRLVEALRRIVGERKEDHPASPASPSPAAELPHPVPPDALLLMSRPMQREEDYAAYEAERERALQFGRRRPAISEGSDWSG